MGDDRDAVPGVPLSAAIAEVRRELAAAIEEGKGSPVAFRAGAVELEFEVAFSTTAAADAGVRLWVVSVGAKGEVSHSVTHRVKVSLTPVGADGRDRLIGSTGSR